jgi:hypothetical protein
LWATANTNTVNSGIISTNKIYLSPVNDGGAILGTYVSGTGFTLGSVVLSMPSTAGNVAARIDGSGIWLWGKSITSGTTQDGSASVFANLDGSCFMSGTWASGGSIVIGSTTLTRTSGTVRFVAKISSIGQYMWAIGTTDLVANNSSVSSPCLPTSDGGLMLMSVFTSATSTYGSTTLSLAGTNTMAIAKVDPSGQFGTSSQSPQGFPSKVSISVSENIGTATTSPLPTFTAV